MIKVDLVRLFDSKDKFMKYVSLHNDRYRDNTDSKSFYVSLIHRYRQAQDYGGLFRDNSYVELMYKTLQAWNMDQRGARLADFDSFEHSIYQNVHQLTMLINYRLERLKQPELDGILSKIWPLFSNLVVMDTKARIVGVSKTLHFLLPDLVMPIDRNNVMSLLYLGSRYSKEVRKEFGDFKDIFLAYVQLAQQLDLTMDDVDNTGWNTSVPKLIDNAIIGFILEITSKVKK